MDVAVVASVLTVVLATLGGGGGGGAVHAAESANGVAVKQHRGRGALDAELVRLHLEEFRMEVIQMKNQLARMTRNSKIVQTILKELRSNRCASASHTMEQYSAIDCPTGFTVSTPTSCYKFFTDRLNWNDAQEACRSLRSHLIRIETEQEEKYIASHLSNTKKLRTCDFWTDATDVRVEGEWRWNSTGREIERARWFVGEPNNSNGQEHCAWMDWYFRWMWNDASCKTEKACFVCEFEV